MSKLLPALALALLVPLITAGKKRQSKQLVSFHLDAAEGDRPRDTTRVVLGTSTYRVSLKPAFSQHDIEGYYPFLADDGRTFGTAFKLNARAAKKLEALSGNNTGRKLFTVAAGSAISFVTFDRAIDDGYIICWKGLAPGHVEAFKAAGFKRIEPATDSQPAAAPAGEPPLP